METDRRFYVKWFVSAGAALLVSLFWIGQANSNVLSEDVQNESIILPTTSTITVTLDGTVTNLCSGDLYLDSPEARLLVADYNDADGQQIVLGPYPAGTELVFAIEPRSWCAGYRYLSTDSSRVRILNIGEGIWLLEWEDIPVSYYPDVDYNDLLLTVALQDAFVDDRQNLGPWTGGTYARGAPVVDTISRWGSALVSIRNLQKFFGLGTIDPVSLNNDILSKLGYTRWSNLVWPTLRLPGQIEGDALLSTGATIPPLPLEYQGTMLAGSEKFEQTINEKLASGLPVIVEYLVDQTLNRAHFVVLTKRVETAGGTQYTVNDPYFGFDEIKLLAASDVNIQSAKLFSPTAQLERSWLVIHAPQSTDMVVTDRHGRRLGYNPKTNQTFADIPGAYYRHEPKLWDPTGGADYSDALGGGLVIELPDAFDQEFVVELFGTASWLPPVEVRSVTTEGALLHTPLTYPGQSQSKDGKHTILAEPGKLTISLPDGTRVVTNEGGVIEIQRPDGRQDTLYPYNAYFPVLRK